MSKRRKVTIISNSVALRVRPLDTSSPPKVYSEILFEYLNQDRKFEVINMGYSRLLTSELKSQKDNYIRTFPHFFILNIGCVDAPPREIPKWYSDIIFHRCCFILHKYASFLYIIIIRKNLRPTLVKLRFRKPWVNKKKFRSNVDEFIQLLKKETFAKVLVVGINSGSDRLEKQLPGITKNYKIYNQILKEVSRKNNAHFIDVLDLNATNHFPDGVHYNNLGHKLVAERLNRKIRELI